MPSRRTFLATFGVSASSVALAGCNAATEITADDPPKPGVDEIPDPDNHLAGANGEWSSFGCNAANTRAVWDGKAPVDGVEERWRVEVPQLTNQAPIVAGGRVYQSIRYELEVYDAKDGSELWTKDETSTTPLVREGTVYLGFGNTLRALDAETGEPEWETEFTEQDFVRTPTMYSGDWLYVPADETMHRVDVETGEVDWSRRLFGELLGSPAVYAGHYLAVASQAGKLYLIDFEGTGHGEWNLPSRPDVPTTAGRENVYVSCFDGTTWGISFGQAPHRDVALKAEIPGTNGGLAVKEHLYAAGSDGLQALDTDTGEQVWQQDIGDWSGTAPAIGRDTLFVGGDKLYAFDPTPKGLDAGGSSPAKRFEKSFHGRVGPGPVLDDGVLYVIAQTGESSFHLLALE
ncbi:outer membrane protein assembly factor BamB family protein [Halorussus halophilus]|uniref:outer membrane protein assembly factor BamB family protein n=1 Tax=Halorussus halophilus TaxID=2650975 RepID=UPI0013016989|nr:PQQ-binding-like beta-propeller repeat protein [Halorussus halophilus]